MPMTPIDRRWERLHSNGWRGIVIQNAENWYTGYAQPPSAIKPTAALQNPVFAACCDAADINVPHHACSCPDWREVFLPHELGHRHPPTK
jgi:hypothetical protein